MTGATYRLQTGDLAAVSTPFPFIGEHMEKPHIPTLQELEDLFREDAPPPTETDAQRVFRLLVAIRTFLYAWDDDLTIRQLAPYVERLRAETDRRP
jgi:hypothetical protein